METQEMNHKTRGLVRSVIVKLLSMITDALPSACRKKFEDTPGKLPVTVESDNQWPIAVGRTLTLQVGDFQYRVALSTVTSRGDAVYDTRQVSINTPTYIRAEGVIVLEECGNSVLIGQANTQNFLIPIELMTVNLDHDKASKFVATEIERLSEWVVDNTLVHTIL